MKSNTVLVMLAGGVGKRMWPLTTDKSVFPFLGEPLYRANVRSAYKAGFRRVVVVTNEANDAVIRTTSMEELVLKTVVQAKPQGMADALLAIRERISESSLLVMSAEDVVDESLYVRIAAETEKGTAFVVGKRMGSYFDGGYLRVADGKLAGIVEKPGPGNEPSDLVNLVFHYFPKAQDFLAVVRDTGSDKDDVYEAALARYAKQAPVRVLQYDGCWLPVKYPWHMLALTRFFLEYRLIPFQGKHVEIRHNVTITGPVYLGNNVRIFENSRIIGPAYIGEGTVIGNNNLIREAIIGKDCMTGFGTEIARSYVGDGCWFHNNYIGDSVIEGNVASGAGSVTANFRLDEGEIVSPVQGTRTPTGCRKLGVIAGRNIKIGVNVSTMPGIKIGSGSFIGAGVVVDKDIPEGSFVTLKQEYVVKKNIRMLKKDAGKH